MQAMQNIAVINGRPSLWGDSVIALVKGSPLCEYTYETVDNSVATCRVKRKGEEEQVRTFTMDDAKQAGLLGKQGPWSQYPKRMLQMRARAFALRDVFPDVLKGMPIAEEVQDYQEKILVPLPRIEANFALAIKGKRTIDSIQNAIDTELAQAKIKANEIAEVISSNLDLLDKEANNYSFLFKDIQSIALKSKDDFALLVKSRIAEYEANQAEKAKEQPKAQEVIGSPPIKGALN